MTLGEFCKYSTLWMINRLTVIASLPINLSWQGACPNLAQKSRGLVKRPALWRRIDMPDS
jgi:hypothetical protein